MKGPIVKTNRDGTPKTGVARGAVRVTTQTSKLMAKAVARKIKGK